MLCETCGVGFWHIDGAGRTVYLNPAMCALLELSSAQEIGDQTYHRFFSEESLSRMRLEHAKRPEGMPSTYEVDLIGLHGARRDVVISGAPMHDTEGALIGLIGTFTDISDRKRAELRLSESEKRLRSLFDASIDAIGVSKAGQHVMVNPAYVRTFGYASESEILPLPIVALIADDERALIAERAIKRSQGDNSLNHYLTRGARKNGTSFPMEVHVSSYEEGGEIYTVVILRDITERLVLEEQLRQSQKMEALGRLAGGVAHDFNNLLMVIMGCADLIVADARAGEQARSNAALIHGTGERAVGLTRQLLALSRSQVVDPSVLELNAVMSETSAMLVRLIGPSVKLSLECGPGLPYVRADPGQLQQVLMNLCVNARDAMPSGGRIWISTRHVSLDEGQARAQPGLSSGHYVQLSVRDSGQGMDEALRQRVFEPFFTTKPSGEGTGLGLSTVYGIVKQSGGHVTVESQPGLGSTFSVYLPAVYEPLSPPRRPAPVAQRGESACVLLVDDELAVRELVQKFLESVGYRVLATGSGQAALRLITAGEQIDIVVSDLLMPGMSGVELARELDRVAPAVPVLFMSGYADDADAALIASRAGSGFLPKPFSLAELTSKLHSLLALRPPL
jgi:PAS domain S-box-containing protein